MKPVAWVIRASVAPALFARAASACGGAASPAVPARTVDVLVDDRPDAATLAVAEDGLGRGIGLGQLDTVFDAGPDGHGVAQMDAALKRPINGRILPETIQAIVRGNFDEMRRCYENGLRPSPNLQGRLTIKFVIDVEGKVTSAVDAGSDLPDREVIQCVADEFKRLRFPKPEGGSVTVVYPIIFSPGD